MDLTIIIPHHNDSKRLKRLIKSIPARNNVEIIVIDDHSSQEEFLFVKEMLTDFQKSININLFSNTRSVNSPGICRNIGIDMAQGKWIIFADSDDYFTDEMYDLVSKHFNEESEIVYFSVTSINEKTGNVGKRHISQDFHVNLFCNRPTRNEELEIRTIDCPWGKMIKRQFINEMGARFEERLLSEDVIFSVSTGLKAERISVDSGIMYCVTEREDSLVHKIDIDSFKMNKEVAIRRHIYLYKNLSKEDRKEINLRKQGLKVLGGAFKKLGLGGFKYYIILKKEHIPLFW